LEGLIVYAHVQPELARKPTIGHSLRAQRSSPKAGLASNTKEIAMVAGAVVYSLELVGVRELTQLATLAIRVLHRVWHGLLQGGGHHGATVYGLESIEDQRTPFER
jgi:hypothetical protein